MSSISDNYLSKANFPSSGNFRPNVAGVMDARTLVDNVEDLTDPNTWKYIEDGQIKNVMLVDGLTVTVKSENMAYMLSDYDPDKTPDHWTWTAMSSKIDSITEEHIESLFPEEEIIED